MYKERTKVKKEIMSRLRSLSSKQELQESQKERNFCLRIIA